MRPRGPRVQLNRVLLRERPVGRLFGSEDARDAAVEINRRRPGGGVQLFLLLHRRLIALCATLSILISVPIVLEIRIAIPCNSIFLLLSFSLFHFICLCEAYSCCKGDNLPFAYCPFSLSLLLSLFQFSFFMLWFSSFAMKLILFSQEINCPLRDTFNFNFRGYCPFSLSQFLSLCFGFHLSL